MAVAVARVDVAAPATAVWARLTDWPAHGRWVPLTTVRVLTDRPDGVGARFVGRTGAGPLGFDDPMEVVEWRPPEGWAGGRCAVVKQGRVVTGGAHFEVESKAGGGCRVTWTEEVELGPAALRPLTRVAAPLISVGGKAAFTRMLRLMAREVEAEDLRDRLARG